MLRAIGLSSDDRSSTSSCSVDADVVGSGELFPSEPVPSPPPAPRDDPTPSARSVAVCKPDAEAFARKNLAAALALQVYQAERARGRTVSLPHTSVSAQDTLVHTLSLSTDVMVVAAVLLRRLDGHVHAGSPAALAYCMRTSSLSKILHACFVARSVACDVPLKADAWRAAGRSGYKKFVAAAFSLMSVLDFRVHVTAADFASVQQELETGSPSIGTDAAVLPGTSALPVPMPLPDPLRRLSGLPKPVLSLLRSLTSLRSPTLSLTY